MIDLRNCKRLANPTYCCLAVAGLFIATSPAAKAQYFWDGNNGTAGFGTASGTWAAPTTGTATAGWSTSSAGTTAISGNSVTTATTDALNFGTAAAGLAAGTITVSGTVNGGDITFGSLSGAIVLSGGTAINLAATATITVNNATDTINIPLTGAGTSFTKAGNGLLIITGANTYTGNTVVSVGTLRFGNAFGNSWSTGTPSLPSSSNLEMNGGIAQAYNYLTRSLGTGSGQIQITGGRSGVTNLQKDANGQAFLVFTSAATTVTWGTSTFNPTTLVLNDTGAVCALRMTNPFDLNGAARTIEVSATGVGGGRGTYASLEGNLTGTGVGSLVKTGAGTLVISGGTSSYTGGTTINNGGVWFNTLLSMPNSGAVTVNTGGILSIGVGNTGGWTTGTSGNGTIGGLLAGSGGRAGGTVSYSGNVFVGFNVTGTQTYSGNITDVGSTLGIHVGNKDSGTTSDTFTAAGTLILSGSNSYTGATTVTRGTLSINSVGAAYAVNSTGLLNGSGTIPSAVTVNSGGTLAGGDPSAVANNSLTLASGFTTLANAKLGVRILTDSPNTSSTNPASNSFFNITGGSTVIDTGTIFVISGTPSPALNGANSDSYRIATGAGNQSLLNINSTTSPGQFDATGLTNGSSFNYSITGDNLAGGNVFLNLTPLPEPGAILGHRRGNGFGRLDPPPSGNHLERRLLV